MIACLFSQFPQKNETFLLRELVAMARERRPFLIVSLKPCRDRVIHEQAKPFLSRTIYAPFVWSRDVWNSQLHFLRQAPAAYWGAWGWVLSRHWRHPIVLLKTLAMLPKTAHFARLIVERGATRVHGFWATYPASAAVIIHRLTGLPYSLSGHAHDLYDTNPAMREKLAGAQFLVTCTRYNKRYLESRLPGLPCPIWVSYHGIELSGFQPVPKRDGPVCRILAVGRLVPAKGFDTLIEACALVRARGIRLDCTIAGSGPLEGALRRHIARRGLERHVRLVGTVSQGAIATLYHEAHLFVLPCIREIHWGIPNVLIEALATKTPVICSELDSTSELVEHGRTGWIAPAKDADAFARAIEALWNDRGLRARLTDAGHARVHDLFALEKTGPRFCQLFDEPRAESLQPIERPSLCASPT